MFKNVKVGIAPLTWTNDDMPELGGDIPFEQCISEMATAGYAGCEIGNKFPTDAEEVLNVLKPNQLVVVSQWCSLHFTVPGRKKETLTRFKKQLQFLKDVGAKMINVCEKGGSIQCKALPLFGKDKPTFTNQQWHDLAVGLKEVGQIAKDAGMGLSYHQHMGTGVQSAEELDRFMHDTDDNLIGLLFDTGHIVYAGMDPVEIVQRYGKRINHVHLKDLRFELIDKVEAKGMSFLDGIRAGTFTVPGDGNIDFKPIFHALFEQQYHGWFLVEAEQYPDHVSPLTYAKQGREYIRSMTGL